MSKESNVPIAALVCVLFAWERMPCRRAQARSFGPGFPSIVVRSEPAEEAIAVRFFRLIIGTALIARDGYECATWGSKSSAPRDIAELTLECAVSRVIRSMPFLWLAVEDKPGPQSLRGYIERNAIALLSNYGRPPLDTPSDNWLGRWCNRERVRNSGLWNSNHVDETFDPAFLQCLKELVQEMEPAR